MTCFQQYNGGNDGQCNNYKILNDKYRNVIYGNTPSLCDQLSASYNPTQKSPDWEGLAWYRILPPAGRYILTTSPGEGGKCGTTVPGWINGFPELNKIGQTGALFE